MLGWHFLQEDRRLRWGTQEVVIPGKTYSCDPDEKLILCRYGMHASKRVIDALQYARGPIVCRVELTGEVKHDQNKSVGRHRKVLWMLDATNVLHEFACRCAEDALSLSENPDPRSLAAIKAKRDWLAGKISKKALLEAASTAWWATTAWWDAGWWVAARDAAWWDARWVAARDAAWAAARDAAWAAARDAAWAAAREKQNRRLTSMVCAAQEREEKS